jgi:hypothetical protein
MHSRNTESQAHSTAMSLKLFDARELHNGRANVLEPFSGEMSAGDVLDVRSQIDTRVLLRVAICCCADVSLCDAISQVGNLTE